MNMTNGGAEIIESVVEMAGSTVQAVTWYRAESIPAFGGRTAESMVNDGKIEAVRKYIASIKLGAFA